MRGTTYFFLAMIVMSAIMCVASGVEIFPIIEILQELKR